MCYQVENPMVLPSKEEEPKIVTYCRGCDQPLWSDDTFLEFDAEYFCNEYCFTSHMGVKTVEGWEIE